MNDCKSNISRGQISTVELLFFWRRHCTWLRYGFKFLLFSVTITNFSFINIRPQFKFSSIFNSDNFLCMDYKEI